MQPVLDAQVYLVDDDADVRQALAWLLRSRHIPCRAFGSAEEMLALVDSGEWQRQACCLLLDVRMPGMSGLALFERLVHRGLHECLPVIFLTGHADLPTAVDAVKRGAFDFCAKPISDNALADRVLQAVEQSRRCLQERAHRIAIEQRLAELTEREREVMQRVIDGLSNKAVADQLQISVRTVEVHRARVFEKMQVKSAVELANLLQQL